MFNINVTASVTDDAPPLQTMNVWSWVWAHGWTHFAFFQFGGENFFFKINVAFPNVNIDHLSLDPNQRSNEVCTQKGLRDAEQSGPRPEGARDDHGARRHGELAMSAAGYVTGDRDVVGLVGQDQPCERIAFHQPAQCPIFSSAAADDPVRAEVKNVAHARDGDCASHRRERPRFDRVIDLAEDDVVDLVECEAGGLDRRVGHDQLLELDLELLEVPLALLPEAVDGEAQYALLSVAQVLDPQARDAAETELPSRLDPNDSGSARIAAATIA